MMDGYMQGWVMHACMYAWMHGGTDRKMDSKQKESDTSLVASLHASPGPLQLTGPQILSGPSTCMCPWLF